MKGFVKIPNTAFEMHLSAIEFYVLCYLCKCRNSVTGKCFPSYNRIISDCHISRSSVARAIKSLKEKGIIRVRYNYENHIQRCNSYELIL